MFLGIKKLEATQKNHFGKLKKNLKKNFFKILKNWENRKNEKPKSFLFRGEILKIEKIIFSQ